MTAARNTQSSRARRLATMNTMASLQKRLEAVTSQHPSEHASVAALREAIAIKRAGGPA